MCAQVAYCMATVLRRAGPSLSRPLSEQKVQAQPQLKVSWGPMHVEEEGWGHRECGGTCKVF